MPELLKDQDSIQFVEIPMVRLLKTRVVETRQSVLSCASAGTELVNDGEVSGTQSKFLGSCLSDTSPIPEPSTRQNLCQLTARKSKDVIAIFDNRKGLAVLFRKTR